MGIISWLIVGAIAGYVAATFVDGNESLGVVGHVVLGMVGALVGGFVAGLVIGGDYVGGFNLATIVVAVIGSIIAVLAWNRMTGRAPTGGRTA
jgi:uncharacterized membrane protein YeaQ/YmgE (transglycosylase-associated protein family)